jgi:hypothetical protein
MCNGQAQVMKMFIAFIPPFFSPIKSSFVKLALPLTGFGSSGTCVSSLFHFKPSPIVMISTLFKDADIFSTVWSLGQMSLLAS